MRRSGGFNGNEKIAAVRETKAVREIRKDRQIGKNKKSRISIAAVLIWAVLWTAVPAGMPGGISGVGQVRAAADGQEMGTGEAAADGQEMPAGEEASGGQAVPDELASLYAQSAVLVDGDSGRVLFSKNGQEQRPMASTTKIMTCIVALERADLEDIAVVSSYAASMPEVRLGVRSSEKYYLKDLLYSLMLESHNDAAVVIAEHVGGSVEGFAQLMNEKAKEIGCTATHFITPNGLDAQDEEGIHSTTAEDLAHIMKYCITDSPKKEEFLKITQTVSYGFQDADGKRSFSCNNHNAFLHMMEGALSGKTGFTGQAGYCYVGALRRDGRTFIVALLACGWPSNKTYKWSDTKKLMTYGIENYEYRQIIKEQEIGDILVEEGIPISGCPDDKVYVKAAVHRTAAIGETEKGLLLRKDEQVETECEVVSVLQAPVEKGMQVGSMRYYLNGEMIHEDAILLEESAEKINYKWCLEQIWKQYAMMKRIG